MYLSNGTPGMTGQLIYVQAWYEKSIHVILLVRGPFMRLIAN
jgi:hypothetical protein